MNARGLALHAAPLSQREKALIALLLVSLIEPLLKTDESPGSAHEGERAKALWEQAWRCVVAGQSAEASSIEAQVASSDELTRAEEPETPAVYRVDYLAALLYAIRTYTDGSDQDFEWSLQRVGDSLEFLDENIALQERVNLDTLVLGATEEFSANAVTGAEIETVRSRFRKARDVIYQSLGASGST